MREKRILVTTQVGTEGTYFPQLAIVQALVERGHRVFFHGPHWTHERAEKAGATPLLAPKGLFYEIHLGKKATNMSEALEQTETAVGLNVVKLLQRHRIDGVVVDGLAHYGPALAAEKLQVPWCTFANRPFDLSDEAGASRLAQTCTDTLRAKLGLPLAGRNAYQDCLSERLVLMGWTAAFDPRPAPPQGLHVGLLCWNEEVRRPSWLRRLSGPIVLVAVSSSPSKLWAELEPRLFSAAADAAERLGVQCVAVMSGFVRKLLPNRRHVRFVHYFPHNLLLPMTRVMIASGSWGHISRALTHGAPLLLVPSDKGTRKNADLCVRGGVATSLELGNLTAETVVERLESLLQDDSLVRRQSQKVAELTRLLNPPVAAAEAIERFLGAPQRLEGHVGSGDRGG